MKAWLKRECVARSGTVRHHLVQWTTSQKLFNKFCEHYLDIFVYDFLAPAENVAVDRQNEQALRHMLGDWKPFAHQV